MPTNDGTTGGATGAGFSAFDSYADARDDAPFGDPGARGAHADHDDGTAFYNESPSRLAAFVQEYVRRENQADAGVLAVIAADLRDPQWLPHQIAERMLARREIQAAIMVLRAAYKPPEIREVSAETISMDMEALYQEAKTARQFTAAIAAKKLQAEVNSLLVKKLDINVNHRASLTDAELEAIAKRGVIEGEFTTVSTALTVVNESAAG